MRTFLCGLLFFGMLHNVAAAQMRFMSANQRSGEVSGTETDPESAERQIEGSDEHAQNLFINSMSVTNSQTPGKASWKATMRFNSNRAPGFRFDPINNPQHDFVATISTHRLLAPATAFTKSGDTYKFKSAKGAIPVVSVTIDISAEKITLSMTKDTFEAPLANQTVPVTVSLGTSFYTLSVALNNKGALVVTPGYRTTAFVGTAAKADLIAPGSDVLDVNALLADPDFHFTPNIGPFPLVIRLFNGLDLISIVNVDQGVFSTTEKDGKIYYKIKSSSAVKKTKNFTYDSKTGKLAMTLSQLTLTSLVDAEEQLGIELDIDGQVYFTQITLFRWNAHTFKYAIP